MKPIYEIWNAGGWQQTDYQTYLRWNGRKRKNLKKQGEMKTEYDKANQEGRLRYAMNKIKQWRLTAQQGKEER